MPQRSGIFIAQSAADLILAASYLAVLAGLVWFLRRRPDLAREHWLLGLLIGCFLALAALTRIADAVAPWHPLPELLALSRAAVALVFAVIIVALVRLLPNLARLPSALQLHEA